MKKQVYTIKNIFASKQVLVLLSLFVLVFALFAPALSAQAATPTQDQATTQQNTQQPSQQQRQQQQQQGSIYTSQPQTTQTEPNGQPQEPEVQSCDDAAGPLSFFLCPVFEQIMKLINWLAGPNDSVLTNMLRVEPLQFNKDTGLLRAYQNILNFVNGLFIIVFLIIIFANFIKDFTFLDNYNVKSTLPRLIAAIILAQFGYLICAVLIDMGNILGTVLPKTISAGVLGPNVAQPALADGVIGLLAFGNADIVGGGTATVTNILFGGAGGIVFLLLLIMAIMAAVALFIAFIYMVARNLILVLLVFATPLAFLAWVLPGTQSFFNAWGRNLIKLIIMFPLVTVLITTAEIVSFLLLHPTLDPSVFTSDRYKLIIGSLIPFVALLMIPKCLKLSGDIMDVTGGAVAGFIAGRAGGKVKEAPGKVATHGKEGLQNRIATSESWSNNRLGRAIVAGPGGSGKKSVKGTVKMGDTRDRAQAVYDKATKHLGGDDLKSMLKQNYRPAKIAALVALAGNGDRATVKEALAPGSGYGLNEDILKQATKKDWGAFDKMPDMRNYYDSPDKQAASFRSMSAKSFKDVSPATMKDWLGSETELPNGVKQFNLNPAMMHGPSAKFSSSQMRNFLENDAVRGEIAEDVRTQLAQYGHAGNNETQQAIRSNLDANGNWL